MLHRLFPLVALLGLLAAVAPASAQSGQIEQMLRARDAEIKDILGDGTPTAAQRDELRDVVNDVIDFEAMAKRALGPYWSELTPAQRRAFVDAFGNVVRAQSLANLDLYRARVTYGNVDVSGNTAVARTTARSGDVDAAVVYDLVKKGGEWFVTDIVIDGASTVGAYENSFQRVMKRQGVEAGYERLMESLRKRLAREG